MPVKQPYYLQTQDPIKLFEPSLQPPVIQQQPLEKKMKPFPMEPYNHNPSEVKVPEFYWDSSYSMADNRAVMAQQPNMDRRSKRSPGVFRPEQDPVPRMPFEVCPFPSPGSVEICLRLHNFRPSQIHTTFKLIHENGYVFMRSKHSKDYSWCRTWPLQSHMLSLED